MLMKNWDVIDINLTPVFKFNKDINMYADWRSDFIFVDFETKVINDLGNLEISINLCVHIEINIGVLNKHENLSYCQRNFIKKERNFMYVYCEEVFHN